MKSNWVFLSRKLSALPLLCALIVMMMMTTMTKPGEWKNENFEAFPPLAALERSSSSQSSSEFFGTWKPKSGARWITSRAAASRPQGDAESFFPQILCFRSRLLLHSHTSTFHSEKLVFGSLETTHSYCHVDESSAHRISHTNPKNAERLGCENENWMRTLWPDQNWLNRNLIVPDRRARQRVLVWFMCIVARLMRRSGREDLGKGLGCEARFEMQREGQKVYSFCHVCFTIQSMFGRTSAVSSEREIIRWETWRDNIVQSEGKKWEWQEDSNSE